MHAPDRPTISRTLVENTLTTSVEQTAFLFLNTRAMQLLYQASALTATARRSVSYDSAASFIDGGTTLCNTLLTHFVAPLSGLSKSGRRAACSVCYTANCPRYVHPLALTSRSTPDGPSACLAVFTNVWAVCPISFQMNQSTTDTSLRTFTHMPCLSNGNCYGSGGQSSASQCEVYGSIPGRSM